MDLTRIVSATDFSEASLPAMEAAFVLAAENKAILFLVHVIEYPVAGDHPLTIDPLTGRSRSYLEDLVEKSQERLEQIIPRNLRRLGAGLTIEKRVLTGSPAEEITRLAREEHADMIVAGTHGRKGLARILLGSTAERILREAPCQVLVVKPRVGIATSQQAGI